MIQWADKWEYFENKKELWIYFNYKQGTTNDYMLFSPNYLSLHLPEIKKRIDIQNANHLKIAYSVDEDSTRFQLFLLQDEPSIEFTMKGIRTTLDVMGFINWVIIIWNLKLEGRFSAKKQATLAFSNQTREK